MFIGKIEQKTDTKGRVFLPAAYRKQLKEEERDAVVVRRNLDKQCMMIYPMSVFQKRLEALQQRLDTEWNAEDEQLMMEYTADAEYVEIDSQGRILLNKPTLEFLQIQNSVLFVGNNTCIAVWAPEVFNAQRMETNKLAALIAQRMKKTENESTNQ